METFSLSRANLMPLPFFPMYACVDVGVSVVLMNHLCVLMFDVIRGGSFFSRGELHVCVFRVCLV